MWGIFAQLCGELAKTLDVTDAYTESRKQTDPGNIYYSEINKLEFYFLQAFLLRLRLEDGTLSHVKP